MKQQQEQSFWRLGILLLFLIGISKMIPAQLNLNWEIKLPETGEIYTLGEKGSVQEVLIENKVLPDPFVGLNENEFSWIENHIWEFSSQFELSAIDLNKNHIDLVFPSIDTYAEVFVNDSLLFFANNAFRTYRYDIKKLVKQGRNKIKLVFYPPVLYHRDEYIKASYHLPAPNDLDSIAIAPYTRKPQYQFGWDWALRMNTIGLNKAASLHMYNTFEIVGKNILTENISKDKADIEFQLELSSPQRDSVKWVSALFGEKWIKPNGVLLQRLEEQLNPELWWPRGQGEAYLYHDTWELYGSDNQLIQEINLSYGIRKSELIQTSDNWGTSYVIRINDRDVFCKGGDYIPQDIFPARVTDENIKSMIQTMYESNFNMVRVWGGGYYPDDVFYEECDRLGLMVWQDFMFACAMYPGDPDFLANVREEIKFHIPRIAQHPSVVLFNGNNEVDVAWKNWGFQVRYGIFGKDAREIEESYDRLFKQLIPEEVSGLSNVPYIHTSPLSNWGKDEFYNHGSQHYWGVWHGKDPMSDFADKIGRFNAEYGFQSFPEYWTLGKFAEEEQWNLDSAVMSHHQKSYVGNGMILKHARKLFGEPIDFRQFVYYSQLTQAHAVRIAVSGHRIDAPRCMGTLYWQVNDCWPAPTWSSMDYYGNWKALQFDVKKAYKDVAVLERVKENKQEFYLVSDQPDTFMCEVFFRVYDLDGKLILENNVSQLVKGFESEKICANCLEGELEKINYIIEFSWKDQKGVIHRNTFLHFPNKRNKTAEKGVELTLLKEAENKYVVSIKSTGFLQDCWIYSERVPIHLNENFMHLLPGNHQFEFYSENEVKLEDIQLMWN